MNLHDYQPTGVASFKVGDKVTLDCYGRKNNCVVREVNVTTHLFKPDARVFYRVDGEADSICTAANMTLQS